MNERQKHFPVFCIAKLKSKYFLNQFFFHIHRLISSFTYDSILRIRCKVSRYVVAITKKKKKEKKNKTTGK